MKKEKKNSYFSNVKEGDILYGLVFGKGKVVNVYNKDDFYYFEANYNNNCNIHYTIDGFPNWGNFDEQTVFYQDDINIIDYDISPVNKVLSIKQIIKLINKNKLDIRTKSGIWRDFCKTPNDYREEVLENKHFHLLRKRPN